MAYDHATYVLQIGLKTLDFDPGPADGLDGPKTRAALKRSATHRLGAVASTQGRPPRPKPPTRGKIAVFGQPGRELALKRVTLPWKMQIVGIPGKYRSTIRMHKLVADLMIDALDDVKKTIGMSGIKEYGLDLFGGDYVNRPPRGSSTGWSDHAFGIALDLNPKANGNKHTWKPSAKSANGTKEMSHAIVKIFAKYGFKLGFKRGSGRRDMMHVSYVDRP